MSLLAYPKSSSYDSLVNHKVFRIHELLTSTILPVVLCEMKLIDNGKHGVDVLKVINDKLVLHLADWQQGRYNCITVEMRKEIKSFGSPFMIRYRVRSILYKRGIFSGIDPWVE